MENLPVTITLTNEETDRLLQLLDLLNDPDALHLQQKIYSQQEIPDTPLSPIRPLQGITEPKAIIQETGR